MKLACGPQMADTKKGGEGELDSVQKYLPVFHYSWPMVLCLVFACVLGDLLSWPPE